MKRLKPYLLCIPLLSNVGVTNCSYLGHSQERLTPCKFLLITLGCLIGSSHTTSAYGCFPETIKENFAEITVDGTVFIYNDSVNANFEIFNDPFPNGERRQGQWRLEGNKVGILVYVRRIMNSSIWANSSSYEIEQDSKEKQIGSLQFVMPEPINISDVARVTLRVYTNPGQETWEFLEQFENKRSMRVKEGVTDTPGVHIAIPGPCGKFRFIYWVGSFFNNLLEGLSRKVDL